MTVTAELLKQQLDRIIIELDGAHREMHALIVRMQRMTAEFDELFAEVRAKYEKVMGAKP